MLARFVAITLLTCSFAAHAASFDCTRARSKLNRMICADPELSSLDSRVWDAYGARLSGASVAQYTHLRERHLAWRRQRGWYDSTIDALKDDYQRHLAWLTHPLLPLEGSYALDDERVVQVELDTDAPASVSLHGTVRTTNLVRHVFSWVVPLPTEAPNHIVRSDSAGEAIGEAVGEARPAVALANRRASLQPSFIGAPPGPAQGCRISITFGDDELFLDTGGQCGARLDGRYVKRAAPSAAWGRQ